MNSSAFILSVIILGAVAFAFYIVFTLIKNERKRNKWLPTMKVGDEVHFSTTGSVNAVITDVNPVNDDMVEVKVLISKKSLYPGKVREHIDIIV